MEESVGHMPPERVALCITCLGDIFSPEVGIATVRLLRRLGVRVAFPEGQTCCGQPAFNAGFRQQARLVAQRSLRIFAAYDYVIVPSGSCTAMFRHFYPDLFADDPVLGEQAEALAQRTYELSEFLVRIMQVESCGATFAGKIGYHPSCHLARELGVVDEPRRLITHVAGAELVPMDFAEQCCGFGGTFLAQADLGLSGVGYVIAETDTLVLSARPGQMRGVSLLPPVHVAVARTEQIVATLADVLLLLQAEATDLQQHLSSCASFITGPSRTGDIELTLTVGVHGPGELHLVLID
jgi:L-lactate dehydrogenase complex protein LldE